MSDALKRNLALAVAVGAVGFCGYQIWGGSSEGSTPVHYRILMDSEMGELVRIEHSRDGGEYPWQNPKTDKRTLFPTEVCYWNQCGERTGGTRVILNHWLNKPEPTTCPTCGREVTRRNPPPAGFTPKE